MGHSRLVLDERSRYVDRVVIPVTKNQLVTLTREISQYKVSRREPPVLALFELCTHQTKPNFCKCVYFGDTSHWPGAAQNCHLPPPSAAPESMLSSGN